MNDELDREIESALHRWLDPLAALPVPSRRVSYSGGSMKKTLLGGAGAALGLKLLTGIAVAAAAVTVAGAATEVATTGSLDPQNWGRQVSQQVEACKDTLRASGTRGIGSCVSQFAKQHGDAVSDKQQGGGESTESGGGDGQAQGSKSTGHDNGNGKSGSKGNGTGHGNSGGHGPKNGS